MLRAYMLTLMLTMMLTLKYIDAGARLHAYDDAYVITCLRL